MSIAPHTGIVDFGTFTAPTASTDGIQGEVPQPLAGQEGYVLTGTGWASAGSVGLVGYQGTWNALTNTPTLTSSVGVQGYYYVVDVAGTTNLNGITDWQVGDWAIFNGSIWQKVDNTDSYDPANVAITGGTINNTTIGATTPSTGVFTTLTAQNETLIGTGQNLVKQSQAIGSSPWNQTGTATAAINNAVAPDSTTTASLITNATDVGFAGNSINQNIQPATAQPVISGITYTFSVYIKAGTATTMQIALRDNSTGNLPTTTLTPTSSWQRISVSITLGSSTTSFYALIGSANGTFYTWGAQVEIGSVVNTYVATTSTVVYGTPTLSFSGVASIGLQSDGSLYETSAGTGNVRFYTNNIGQEQARVSHTVSAVNYVQVTGGATTKGVIQSAQGSDSNISYVTQSKGTGAIDLAAGSKGVNISNGGTVTAITITSQGSNYTSIPTTAIDAPTTAGGVQATFSVGMYVSTWTVTNGGTGYTVGDLITAASGGTYSTPWTLLVTAVSGGVITAISTGTGSNAGTYTVLPSGAQSVTGGTGSSATITINTWGVRSGTASITNAGSGYVEQPTVTFSGGGGSGAAAYATVGGTTIIRSLGTNLDFYTPVNTTSGAPSFRVYDNQAAGTGNYFATRGSVSAPLFIATGGTNVSASISSSGSGNLFFYTNSAQQEQFRVAHTASAVNYVQVTGSATGQNVNISAQGSDTDVWVTLQSKNGAGVVTRTGGTGGGLFVQNSSGATQFNVANVTSAVNYFQAKGSITGFGPVLSAQGSDTNIPAVVQPKGTGALQAQQTDSTATGGNARGANAVDWQTSRTAASQVASATGSFIGSGSNNTASGWKSSVVGGNTNASTSSVGYAFIGGGTSNTASGAYSFIGSGASNAVAGYYNFVGGGFTNSGTASAAVTTQSATMNGTTAVTLSGSNASIKVGQYITGTSIADDTYVAAISGTSLTLSKVASGSSTSTLSFYTPHGVVVGGGNNQATGSYSFIGGGGDAGTAANRNVASGDWSVVAGGLKGVASGQNAFVGGGSGAIASGTYAVVSGGVNNQATGFGSTAIGGYNNISNSAYSATLGGNFASTRGIEGISVFGSQTPLGGTLALAQSSLLVLAVQTTDATATVLRSNASAASTTNQVILPNNSAYYFKGSVIANVTGAANGAAWSIEGAIMRGANAASTVLMGTPAINRVAATAGATAWAIAITADTTNGGLAVTVTGAASTTIRWVCSVNTTETTF